jgi:hypothetical protein
MHNCGVLSGSSLVIGMHHFLHTKLPRGSCSAGCQLHMCQADDEVAIKCMFAQHTATRVCNAGRPKECMCLHVHTFPRLCLNQSKKPT